MLFGHPARSFYANEIIRMAGCGSGAVQRELARLEASGLVTVTRIGKQKHYQANAASPVFEERRSFAIKTFALAGVLRDALAPLAGRVEAAFVHGSIAKGEDVAASDIDLMVIADDLPYADLFTAVEEASGRLGRKVAPTIYSPEDWAKRRSEGNAFVTRVLAQPKLWLIGDERALATGEPLRTERPAAPGAVRSVEEGIPQGEREAPALPLTQVTHFGHLAPVLKLDE